MRLNCEIAAAPAAKADLLVLPLFEGSKKLAGTAAALDKLLGGELSEALAEERLEGKEGESAVVKSRGRIAAARVMLLGAGQKPFGVKSARRYAALAAAKARLQRAKSVALALPEALEGGPANVAAALAEGALLGDYRFLRYKGEDEMKRGETDLESLTLLAADKRQKEAMDKAAARGELYARGAIFARDLVNEPASVTTPKHLADAAVMVAGKAPKRLSVQILDRAKLEELGMGGLLAVAKGSDQPPYLFHLTYKPAKKAKKRIVVVGKGLTFDSGGLSLKPSEGMEDMKIDMSGAAAVLGLFSVIAELAPAVEVHGIAGLCENMPSGKAVRPGDVVKTMSGKTVEILNTDAEGRVTLADTLHYACGLEPDAVVDLATLTGACMVALGQEVAGLMSNSKPLAAKILAAADETGELLWTLPLVEEYRESIKSRVADLKNISGTRYGGAITAGLFLREFVGKTPWAHLDIAGPAWAEKETVPYQPLGATGYGVRSMIKLIERL